MADENDDDKTAEAIGLVTATVFAWLRNSADADGKVQILRGEVGQAAEKIATHLIAELVDFFASLGWPIKIEADKGATVSVDIED